jgi:hypothetical protein
LFQWLARDLQLAEDDPPRTLFGMIANSPLRRRRLSEFDRSGRVPPGLY